MDYQRIQAMMIHGGELLDTKLNFDALMELPLAEAQFAQEVTTSKEEISSLCQDMAKICDGHSRSTILWALIAFTNVTVDEDLPSDYLRTILRLMVARKLFQGMKVGETDA